MGTSTAGGEIRFDPAELGEDRFVDTGLARDFVDTLLHKADQAAQCRANWVAPVAGLWSASSDPHVVPRGDDGTEDSLDEGGTGTDEQRYYFFGMRAVFPPKIRANGAGYKIVVRLGGASSDGGTVDFGVAVLPKDTLPSLLGYASDTPFDRILTAGVTSTTPAWLTPDGGSYVLDVSARLIEAAAAGGAGFRTLDDVGGSEITTVIPELVVVPFGQTRAAGTSPQVFGFWAQEFVGAS